MRHNMPLSQLMDVEFIDIWPILSLEAIWLLLPLAWNTRLCKKLSAHSSLTFPFKVWTTIAMSVGIRWKCRVERCRTKTYKGDEFEGYQTCYFEKEFFINFAVGNFFEFAKLGSLPADAPTAQTTNFTSGESLNPSLGNSNVVLAYQGNFFFSSFIRIWLKLQKIFFLFVIWFAFWHFFHLY